MTNPTPTVLIVDDGPNVANAYALGLEDDDVEKATSGEEAFDIVDLPVDAFLTKPVEVAALRPTVEQLLELGDYGAAAAREFRLKEKLANLENELSPDELARSDDYAELKSKLDTLDGSSSSDHEAFRASLSK